MPEEDPHHLISLALVNFGSLADIGPRMSDVRFPPQSGYDQLRLQRLLFSVSLL
jgi:hypothetical protein